MKTRLIISPTGVDESSRSVHIVAPSAASSKEHLKWAQKFLQDESFTCPKNPYLLGPDPLCANTDALRFEGLKKAITSPGANLIWCLRGGYGALRLLPYLKKLKAPKVKKLFIGYSDATVLHFFLAARWGWPTLHAPNLRDFILKEVTAQNKKAVLNFLRQPQQLEYKLKPLEAGAPLKSRKPVKPRAIRTAPLMGGNLSVLQTLVGTSLLPDGKFILKGRTVRPILFLEDVNEPAYKIDRMLTHLYLAGVLKNIRALVWGDLVAPENQQVFIQYIKRRWASLLKVPVYEGLPVGHGRRRAPLLLHAPAYIQHDE